MHAVQPATIANMKVCAQLHHMEMCEREPRDHRLADSRLLGKISDPNTLPLTSFVHVCTCLLNWRQVQYSYNPQPECP